MRKILILAAAMAAGLAGTSVAATCEKTSGPGTAAVLELYTSEGCSSCPPADKWLSGVSRAGGEVVALGFHVDYWDYIGWKDAFASAAYSQRQKDVNAAAKNRVIYTPQLMLNGRDYRDWDDTDYKHDLAKVQQAPAKAQLRIALQPGADALAAQVQASVPNAADRNGAALYLALTQNNLVTPVKAGENRGVTLHHDNVVREWIGPIAFDASGNAQVSRELKLPKGAKLESLSVSAVVQKPGSGEVLQALALPACKA